MQISIQPLIFLISCLLIFHASADLLYTTLCEDNDLNIICEISSTWAFDKKTKKCYPVIRGKEPCGYFQREETCIDICLKKEKVSAETKQTKG